MWWKILLIVLLIAIVILGLLYYFGSKAQKKQVEQQQMMEAMAQNVNLLVIDKKKMKITEAGLPKPVVDGTPWYLRRTKVPVVKAKVGPRVMTFMCDQAVFDRIPVKQEIKATVSGLYITAVKGIRNNLLNPPKKKSFFDRFKKAK